MLLSCALAFHRQAACSTILCSSDSLFTLSLQLLFHVFVFLFHSGPTASISAEISFLLTLRLCTSPLINASFVHLLPHQVAPTWILSCHTTLCFAVMARFKTALFFFHFRQGARRTRPTHVAWSLSRKEAAASSSPNHSSEYSSTSSSTQCKSLGLPFHLPSFPPYSLPTFGVFCARPWPPMSTCTFSVCAYTV